VCSKWGRPIASRFRKKNFDRKKKNFDGIKFGLGQWSPTFYHNSIG